jgi:small nuclear ribonucleoprotein (snRNP)-like protein
MLLRSLLLLLLLAAPAAAEGERAVRIVTTDGSVVEGRLLGWDAQGFRVQTEAGEVFVDSGSTEQVKFSALEPEPEPEPEPTWVVVETRDGRTLSGTLIRWTDDALEVQVGSSTVTLPRADIARVASGSLDAPLAVPADEPPPPARPRADVPSAGVPRGAPLPPARPAYAGPGAEARAFRDGYLNAPGWVPYSEARLELVDRHGTVLGPRSLGYPARALGRDNRRSFKVVEGKAPDLTLTFEAFLELVDDEALTARHQRFEREANDKVGYGVFATILGASLITTAPILGTVSTTTGPAEAGIFVPIHLGAGIPFLTSGIFTLGSGLKWQKRLAGDRLWYLYEREEAWLAIQGRNAALRKEHGLPDDHRLDAAE